MRVDIPTEVVLHRGDEDGSTVRRVHGGVMFEAALADVAGTRFTRSGRMGTHLRAAWNHRAVAALAVGTLAGRSKTARL
jgi:hypothetical protein